MSIKSIQGLTQHIMGGALLLAGKEASAQVRYNMPEGATEISQQIYHLHMLSFWICVAIGLLVFGAMVYSIVRFRKSKGAQPAHFHENTFVEILWTTVPFLILISMAIPAAGTLIRMADVSKADMTVKITGYQWKWQYDYLDQGVSFFSTLGRQSNLARQLGSNIDPATVENYLLDVDHPLVLPVGVKVRLVITSNDVIHSWWVPDFANKTDALPGFINETWLKIEKPGIYRGQCAELCGRDHAFMPIVVVAKPKAEFDAWLAQQKEISSAQGAGAAATPASAATSAQ